MSQRNQHQQAWKSFFSVWLCINSNVDDGHQSEKYERSPKVYSFSNFPSWTINLNYTGGLWQGTATMEIFVKREKFGNGAAVEWCFPVLNEISQRYRYQQVWRIFLKLLLGWRLIWRRCSSSDKIIAFSCELNRLSPVSDDLDEIFAEFRS